MRQAVLHLSSEHGWRGGERQVWLLSRGLARRGVTVVVAAPAGSPLAERAAASGIEVLELRRGRPIHPGNVMRLMVWLWRRPGAILHAQTSPALDWAAACRFLARPRGRLGGVVHTRRVSFPARRSRKYQSWADRYVAISQAVAGRLQEAGVDESRLVVIPSAVEIEPIDRARPAPELAELVHAAGQGPVVS